MWLIRRVNSTLILSIWYLGPVREWMIRVELPRIRTWFTKTSWIRIRHHKFPITSFLIKLRNNCLIYNFMSSKILNGFSIWTFRPDPKQELYHKNLLYHVILKDLRQTKNDSKWVKDKKVLREAVLQKIFIFYIYELFSYILDMDPASMCLEIWIRIRKIMATQK